MTNTRPTQYSAPLRANRYKTTQKTWLYSISQQKEIIRHRFNRKTNKDIWFLLPGVYFTIVLHNQKWRFNLLRIHKDGSNTHEEPYFIPQWIYQVMPQDAKNLITYKQKGVNP